MSTRKRIAVLNTHPIQYFAPLYAHLNASDDIEVEALYLSDTSGGGFDAGFGRPVQWDLNLLSGYPYKFIASPDRTAAPTGRFLEHVAPQVWSVVRNGGYDALWLHGHGYAANMLALAAARSISLPVVMRCETHLRLPRSAIKKTLRGSVLRLLYSQCDRFLAIGSANREFYRSLGVSDEKIFFVPYAVDNRRFIEGAKASARRRSLVRGEHGVHDDAPVILYLSKLQHHKRPQDLVDACILLKERGFDFHLWLAGTGEMKDELESAVIRNNLTNVRFLGFVNQSALPDIYAAADVFVLPSAIEPWGLVVNEAMCAGLPVVASDAVASADDLVRPGENGDRFAAGDANGLARALAPILQSRDLREQMSRASKDIVSGWGFDECLDGLREAVRTL